MIEQHQALVAAVKARKPIDTSTLPDIPGFEPLPLPPYMSTSPPATASSGSSGGASHSSFFGE